VICQRRAPVFSSRSSRRSEGNRCPAAAEMLLAISKPALASAPFFRNMRREEGRIIRGFNELARSESIGWLRTMRVPFAQREQNQPPPKHVKVGRDSVEPLRRVAGFSSRALPVDRDLRARFRPINAASRPEVAIHLYIHAALRNHLIIRH